MRLLILVSILALGGCSAAERAMNDAIGATSPTASGPTVDFSGTWDTRWGTMTLRQAADGRVTGSYDDEDGTIEGAVSGNTLTGYWSEPHANNTCDTQRNGTPHWGRIEFRAVGSDRFDGGYTDCSNPMHSGDRYMGSEWNGTRVR